MAEEVDVTKDGEVDLHSPNAVEEVAKLQGVPVDETTSPTQPGVPPPFNIVTIPPPAPGMPRILLVVPILDIEFKFFESFLKFWTALLSRSKPTFELGYYFIYRKPVHIAETLGVNVAKFNKCTHVLFMDDDIYDITPDMVEKLLVADKDVIAGHMYTSSFPYASCSFRRFDPTTTVTSQPAQTSMYRLYEIQPNCPNCSKKGTPVNLGTWDADFCPKCRQEIKDFAIQPIDLIPFCFTLMKMSVFDRIKIPWFHCNSIFPTDSWFADRCKEVGIQEWIHMNVRLNHKGVTDLTRQFKFNEQMAIFNSDPTKVINLTPEQMSVHEVMMKKRMLEAERSLKYGPDIDWIRVEDGFVEPLDLQKGGSNEQKEKGQCNSST